MKTVNEFSELDKQRNIDYLQKLLDTQIAYANELEVQMGLKEAENKRLREIEENAEWMLNAICGVSKNPDRTVCSAAERAEAMQALQDALSSPSEGRIKDK